MKGIGHFLTGIAVGTCFPEAMRASVQDNSFILLLTGAFGLLPDTLDFRVGRYLWKHDYTVTPDLKRLDAKPIAEAVANAIDEAAQTGKTVKLKLNTLKVSASYHRTYSIRVDEERKVVTAKIGPLKTMGQVIGGGSEGLPRSVPPAGEHGNLEWEAPFKADMVNQYHRDTQVAIFSGPDFAFVPNGGKVRMDFIPWHRTWAHSPFLGVLCGLLGWLIYALAGDWSGGAVAAFTSPLALTALFASTLAFWGHIMADQVGVLGSVLLWPFSDKRSAGFGLSHASSIMGNITLNSLCLAVIIWNIIVHTPGTGIVLPWAACLSGGYGDPLFYLVSLANFFTYFFAFPLAALVGGIALFKRLTRVPPKPASATGEDEEDEEDAEAAGDPGDAGML
jgi:membrane-bound metal-dependent hydrolase YbcI (DUF457 family)